MKIPVFPVQLPRGQTHVVHLTHNDLDAVGADAMHRMKFGKDDVFTVWSSVGKFTRLFSLIASCPGKGDLLSISDLGHQRDIRAVVVRARLRTDWAIEWRDHHRWRDEEVAEIKKEVSLLHIESRCLRYGIVARRVAAENQWRLQDCARVVCDYDLWNHADPRSAVLGQVDPEKETTGPRP